MWIVFLNFSENGINIVFEVTEDKKLLLSSFSNSEKHFDEEYTTSNVCSTVAVQVMGENPDDHHGAKHTGTSCEKTLKYINHSYYENEYGNKLEFELQNDKLKVILNYQFYKNISAVKTWTDVFNISKENVGLEYISTFTYTGLCDNSDGKSVNEKLEIYIPHNSWVRELDWKKYTLSQLGFERTSTFSTKRINISNTGTWSSKEYLPMGAVTDTAQNCTIMWQIENNGSWQWEIGDIKNLMYLRISGPNEQENHWYKELKPNEHFKSVPAAITIGKSFDDTLAEMTKYRRRIVRKNEADENLPVIFNDYMNCLWADPTTEKEIPVIDCAAELGAEYYCMDAGWYADGTWWETVGEWQPCEWRFKNGIKEVFDYIRQKGMIPGIWLEIEVMGIDCPILDQFTDDCFFMRRGKRVIDHGRYQLDFRSEKVRSFATSVIDRVVSEYGVGYIKMDYNIDAGIGTDNNADSFGDGLLEHNRAYLEWTRSIMDKYPELVIENCSSGGMRMDYAMLSLHPIQSVTDQSGCVNMVPIAAGAATAVLPEQAAIWSYPVSGEEVNITAINMVNSMLLRMHLSGEVMNLSDEQKSLVIDGVKKYKEIRKYISEAIPFYPLGLPKYHGEWQCAGYRNDSKVFLAVWRMDSDQNEITIPLKANKANIVYGLKDIGVCTINDDNVLVKINQKNNAIIIELDV